MKYEKYVDVESKKHPGKWYRRFMFVDERSGYCFNESMSVDRARQFDHLVGCDVIPLYRRFGGNYYFAHLILDEGN